MPELTVTELTRQVAEARTLALDAQTALNIVWTLLCGFLVMFMQAGFALVETGLTRAKNVAHTMGMNFLVYSIGILGYWAIGFGLQMGGVGALGTFGNDATLSSEFTVHLAGKDFGLFGMVAAFTGFLALFRDFGLSMAVITEDYRAMRFFREECEFGMGYVNLPCIGAEVHLPFGGVKRSGNGHPSAAGLVEAVTHKIAWTVNHGTEVKMAQGLTTAIEGAPA